MYQLNKVVLFLSLVIMTVSAKAEEKKPECATREEISAIMNLFTFMSNDEVTKNKGVEDCSRDSAAGPAFGGIAFMSKFDPLPSLKKSLDQNILGPSPLRFLTKRVKNILFVKDDYVNCAPADALGRYTGAFVNPYQDTVYVCRESSNLDAFEMASLFVHEARHVDGYGHEACLRGVLKGHAACDGTYEGRGSYAVGTEYYLRLSAHPEISPTLKASARILGIAELWGRFNKLPIGLRGRLMLQESNGDLFVLDRKKLTPQVSAGDAVLITREDGNAFIDPQARSVKTFFAEKWTDTEGIMAGNIREGKLDIGADKIIDAMYGDKYACVLLTGKMICTVNLSGVYSVIELKNITAVGMIYASSTTLVQSKTPYLVGEDGYLYRLPPELQTILSKGEASFTKTKQKYPYKKIVTVSEVGGEFVLTHDGKVYHTPGESKNLKPVKELEGKIFRSIAPVGLWSDELNDFL